LAAACGSKQRRIVAQDQAPTPREQTKSQVEAVTGGAGTEDATAAGTPATAPAASVAAAAAASTKRKKLNIIAVPEELKRQVRRTSRQKITSNGTIAAAVMVFAAIIALIVANTDAYELVHELLEEPIGLTLGPIHAELTIESFVNDFLMAIFFLLVGIELKYEMTVGELRKPRQAALPMLAAVGGVAIPALIYVAFNAHSGQLSGWAIPMATDIAFALGVMSLLGKHVAPATKVFFSTLAIADDILAILVIAVFYGHAPSIPWLAASAACLVLLALFNHLQVYSCTRYVVVGLILWFCMFQSGIHATLAGVLLALFLPAKSDIRLSQLRPWLADKSRELDNEYNDNMHVLGQHEFTHTSYGIERVMHRVTPPLERVERAITVPVNFVILPLFAFVNAQVRLVGVDPLAVLLDPVTLGSYFGAILGKPLGIIGVTLILVKIGFAKLPRGVDWSQIVGVGIMGGLGFTMSILIAGLAFTQASEVLAAKVAILLGSLTAGVVGAIYILIAGKIKEARLESKAHTGGATPHKD
jgi:NhaA family Na+:H+ antiporter